MSNASARANQGERRGDNTRARLIAAATELFSQHGYHRTQVVDIASRARASAGTFYRYFDDKQGIFAAIAEELSCHEVSEAERTRAMVLQASDFPTAIRNMVVFLEQHFERVTQRATLYRALENSGVVDLAKDHAGTMRERVVHAVAEQLRRSGAKDTEDHESLARMVIGVISELRHGMIHHGRPSPAQAARLVTRFLQGAMAAYTTREPRYQGMGTPAWVQALDDEAPV